MTPIIAETTWQQFRRSYSHRPSHMLVPLPKTLEVAHHPSAGGPPQNSAKLTPTTTAVAAAAKWRGCSEHGTLSWQHRMWTSKSTDIEGLIQVSDPGCPPGYPPGRPPGPRKVWRLTLWVAVSFLKGLRTILHDWFARMFFARATLKVILALIAQIDSLSGEVTRPSGYNASYCRALVFSRGQTLNTIYLFSNFRAPPGYDLRKSNQQCFPGLWGAHRTFWLTPHSRGTPLPHRKISGPTSLSLCCFVLPCLPSGRKRWHIKFIGNLLCQPMAWHIQRYSSLKYLGCEKSAQCFVA